MRIPRSFRLSAAALFLGGFSQSHAAYQAVENFNALTSGAIGGQNGWVVTSGDTTTSTVAADPDNAANKVLKHTGINDAYKLLSTSAIADASTGTLFYRVRLASLTNDVSFGLSDQSPPSLTDFNTFEVQNNATGTNGNFGSRDGTSGNPGGFGNRSPLFNMLNGVWYNVWVVADTTADTYRIYVKSAGHAAYVNQTEITSPDGAFNFRNVSAANPLQAFVVISNSASSNLYFDDIYVDPIAANLTNPLDGVNNDTDSDGLDDSWEQLYFTTTTAQNGSGDPDNDTYTNEQEETAGSNPNSAASTPLDTDADGLLDSWEVTHFTNKTSQDGAGDADGDGASNEAEETAGTSPVNANVWPDSDGDGLRDAWEILYFGNLTTATSSSADNDSDGATNLAEMQAGSNPNSSASTPTQAALAHRWSFNGDLNDSVGTSHATVYDPDTNAAVGGGTSLDANAITLAGGASGTSAAVRLGGNLVGGKTAPVTIELWTTNIAVQNWGRIFDFGSGTTEYLFMSFVRGTDTANDQVEWVDNGANSNRGTTNATSYALGTKYHVVLTLTPAAYTGGAITTGTRVTWYIAPANSAATVVAKGTFDTPYNLVALNDTNNYLGRSMWAGDNVANASYDEVRIWNGALTAAAINTYQLAGPNAFVLVDTDSDGLSDAWENTYFGSLAETGSGDFDNDTHSNSAEYNAGSDPTNPASTPSDTDGDTLPDSWEIENFANLGQTASGDPDGDLATNLQEYQARFSVLGFSTDPRDNTSWPDTDFDGMNDAWELIHFGSLAADPNEDPDDDGSTNSQEYDFNLDPNNYLSSRDSDADGLVDGWEVHNFKLPGETGLNDLATIIARQSGTDDPDADGFSNALEYAFLTNPASNTSVPGDIDGNGTNDGPMLKIGGDLINTESFTNGLNWHDGAAPVAGKSYIVSVNGLRTPTTGAQTFAGDRLVLTTSGTNVGTLIWKTNDAVTIPVLQLDGGTINQAAGTAAVALNGTIVVSKNSTLFVNNGGFLINSTISGTGDLTLTGNNVATFAGVNTWTGDLVVPAAATATANRFTLAATGSLTFAPAADGVTNAITGAGVITLDGAFTIDTSAAATAPGSSWTLVATTGAKTYGASFHVNGYGSNGAAAGSRKWTSTTGPTYYQFDEATGALTITTNPDSDSDGLSDEWETTHFGNLAQNGSGDPDNDGATNAQEYAAGSNPNSNTSWPDSDGDGVNDAWEIATFGNLTTATITDKDGDGLLDTWEVAYFGSIDAQNGAGNPDGDAYTNEQEETANSNPTVQASVPGDQNGDGIADGHKLLVADAVGTTSFNSGLNWAGSVAPAAGENYLVDINSLRTPADANPQTFAGDKLVLYTGGNLLVKGSGALTFPGNLVLHGGRFHNGTDANVSVTVEGAISVTAASEIYAQNQGFVFNAVLSGSGNLTLSGANPVTFAGANTWTGGLALTNTGGFTLAETGAFRFAPGASGVTNAITGTNPAVLNGTFHINTSAASTTPGSSWILVATSGAKTYGATFTVSGYTSDGAAPGARKWTSGAYVFDEATGTLSIPGAPVSGIAAWRQTHFGTTANTGDAADSADPDADGLANLLEYALGGDPKVSDSAGAITTAVVGGKLTLTFDHIDDPTLTYVVQGSDTLASWSTVQSYTGLSAVGTITCTDTVTLGAGARRFLRLQVTPAP